MATFTLRRTTTVITEVTHDGGPSLPTPRRKAVICAVVTNPFAGRYEAEIESAMADLGPLAERLAASLIAVLGGPDEIESYGKGAIVGVDGELEHGALWHNPGGWAMREALGGSKAIVPSSKVVGPIGTRLVVPLAHREAAYVRSHFDSVEAAVDDAPRPEEIVLALAMSDGPRVHARVGGLRAQDIIGEDGLR
ncbi:amino acid synthesis family protein [Euzebya tangerina]|uniref:amino acid synthesis family protein n=1 Tax=Euzebya tangerina TaxID=591198 RepID=UPI000E315FD2|nr:amino acid synthesis family protein [Euzebya tangerina]